MIEDIMKDILTVVDNAKPSKIIINGSLTTYHYRYRGFVIIMSKYLEAVSYEVVASRGIVFRLLANLNTIRPTVGVFKQGKWIDRLHKTAIKEGKNVGSKAAWR